MILLKELYNEIVQSIKNPPMNTDNHRFVENVFDKLGIMINCDLSYLKKTFSNKSFSESTDGNIAVYIDKISNEYVYGIVLGKIEKQFCYYDNRKYIVESIDYGLDIPEANFEFVSCFLIDDNVY